MEPVLNVKNLTMNFGGLKALDDVNISVEKGQIAALIGPNGAGKTTFFNCITGIYDPTKGYVEITPPGKRPERIKGLKPNHVTEKGMSRTFQNRIIRNSQSIFPEGRAGPLGLAAVRAEYRHRPA